MRTSVPSLQTSFLFCLMVFAFSAVLWLLVELIGEGPDIPVNLPVSSLMAFFPLITACILAYRRDKGKGVRDLFRRLTDWRSIRRNVWYLPAFTLIPAVMFVSWLYMTLANYPLPEPDLHWPMIPVMFAVVRRNRMSTAGRRKGGAGCPIRINAGAGCNSRSDEAAFFRDGEKAGCNR
ncbi:hypothetical protein Theco_2888 [Thermobacillus composti KWC4]|uniref:Uncharacterized protein n=1 Tax=Thermobacillus composti (strain DSM 18247 / JCM 13945 / KWC4) TaxID=717605 RepID=L0EGP9_THECK|nr:hypothetical protein [Thermobacillus composti]AGA58972.1 hypothetical protein Theco_2888 [Thermobacillus composti KWC4]